MQLCSMIAENYVEFSFPESSEHRNHLLRSTSRVWHSEELDYQYVADIVPILRKILSNYKII